VRETLSGKVRVQLAPLGVSLEVDCGSSLESALAPYGIEFPCGGAGICRGCRVRVLSGSLPVTPEMEQVFEPAELAAGWRLACCANVEGPLTLEVAQWKTAVLSDDSEFIFEPSDGLGIAIDLGTTTLVVQLLDLATGRVMAVETALNPQSAHGADLMSRINFAIEGGAHILTESIRVKLGEMIASLPGHQSAKVVMLAGNTAMHHLFCGIDVSPLARLPFQPVQDGEQHLSARELGWDLPPHAGVHFLPCLGGFVGSDILAGILATGMAESAELCALIDLGTNGEIVVGNRERLLCASTAAGPAFEGGRIRMGMRAAEGAIAHVSLSPSHQRDGLESNQLFDNGSLQCRVLGNVTPRGICGSGLVDAAAVGLQLGVILANGKMSGSAREFRLQFPVSITQADIRELQLAKAAIAAGLRILTERWGASPHSLHTVYLAGAFGNYLNLQSARRIGLLEADATRIRPAGNTSLRGVKMTMLRPSQRQQWMAEVRARTRHIALAADPRFEETFVDCLAFAHLNFQGR
jgi:uncharacterized 2Fe-2S/4Fe-4S cluster protein (DUF4445 family)